MSSQHSFYDGRGTVKVYAALAGCACNWCQMKRSEVQRHSYAHEPDKANHTAAARVDRAVKAYMAKHGAIDYAVAMREVLRADDRLAADYANFSSYEQLEE